MNLKIFPRHRFTSHEDQVFRQHNYRTIARVVTAFVQESQFKTVEALATGIAHISIEKCRVERITVKVQKPNALLFAHSAGVEITRSREFFFPNSNAIEQKFILQNPPLTTCEVNSELASTSRTENPPCFESEMKASLRVTSLLPPHVSLHPPPIPTPPASIPSSPVRLHFKSDASLSSNLHTVYLALGSNLGNRCHNVAQAVTELEKKGCTILDTSFMYETPAAYVLDQPAFINAACKVRKKR